MILKKSKEAMGKFSSYYGSNHTLQLYPISSNTMLSEVPTWGSTVISETWSVKQNKGKESLKQRFKTVARPKRSGGILLNGIRGLAMVGFHKIKLER